MAIWIIEFICCRSTLWFVYQLIHTGQIGVPTDYDDLYDMADRDNFHPCVCTVFTCTSLWRGNVWYRMVRTALQFFRDLSSQALQQSFQKHREERQQVLKCRAGVFFRPSRQLTLLRLSPLCSDHTLLPMYACAGVPVSCSHLVLYEPSSM